MLRGINQSMVNRSIAGGVNCKCIGGNDISGGSNGNSINGGKITAEITSYGVDGESIIKQQDVESLFNEIVSLDPEKYTIYQFTDQMRSVMYDAINIFHYSCDYAYSQGLTDGGAVAETNYIINNNDELIAIYRDDNGINYEESKIFDTAIIDNPQGTPEPREIHKLTLYYREL